VSTAAPEVLEATRRHLTARQAEVVERLTAAAVQEVREVGYDALTVRNVARRAGVAAATAYTYFSSKDHLLAEVMWRRFGELPDHALSDPTTPVDRAITVLRDIGVFMADDPALAAAGTTALLGSGPDVKALRDRIGVDIHRRLRRALGEDADPTALWALELAYTGAMLLAGMGNLPFDDVPDRLAEVALLILRGGRHAA
jgi:AcrR family transcriptional regulator